MMINQKSAEIKEIWKDVIYIPLLKSVWIGHYRVRFKKIIFSIIYFYFLFHLFYFDYFPHITNHQYFLLLSFTTVFSLMLFSFLTLIYEGPGYLPFYYRSGGTINCNSDCHSNNKYGIAISITDHQIARQNPVGNNAFYIFSERRFVIRPHCQDFFSGIWIGRRNFKLSIYFNIYIFLVQCLNVISYFNSVKGTIYNYGFDLCFIIYTLSSIMFVFLCLLNLITIFFLVTSAIFNVTEMENCFYPNSFHNYISVVKNLKVFLGSNVLLWFIPVPAFRNITDEELFSS